MLNYCVSPESKKIFEAPLLSLPTAKTTFQASKDALGSSFWAYIHVMIAKNCLRRLVGVPSLALAGGLHACHPCVRQHLADAGALVNALVGTLRTRNTRCFGRDGRYGDRYRAVTVGCRLIGPALSSKYGFPRHLPYTKTRGTLCEHSSKLSHKVYCYRATAAAAVIIM